MQQVLFRFLLGCLVVGGAACTPDEAEEGGTGGQAGSGTRGATSSGGAGGSASSGAGGTKASGGDSGSGTGGSQSSGGASASGGTGSGGSASGGSSGSGSGGAGGTTGSGGSDATGGTTTTGGRAGRDGGSGNGGATSTGGSAAGGTGGGTSSGGATGSGGSPPDGASPDASPDGKGDSGSTFTPCPATPGTACAILPLGDSITEGCCTSPMGGYRIELYRQALKNGKNITFVGSLSNGPSTVDGSTFPKKHEGHGGYTIDTMSGKNGISGQITDQALASYHPHIVLLKIGTNDINGNVDIANAPTRLGKLMDEIISNAPSALLVVSAIIPTTNDGTNQRVRAYNDAIPALVDARAKAGKHVVFLDNYQAFAQNSNYKTALMADGLHPNTAGYAVLGQSFYDAISDLLPAAP